jgi:hypothetical protein
VFRNCSAIRAWRPPELYTHVTVAQAARGARPGPSAGLIQGLGFRAWDSGLEPDRRARPAGPPGRRSRRWPPGPHMAPQCRQAGARAARVTGRQAAQRCPCHRRDARDATAASTGSYAGPQAARMLHGHHRPAGQRPGATRPFPRRPHRPVGPAPGEVDARGGRGCQSGLGASKVRVTICGPAAAASRSRAGSAPAGPAPTSSSQGDHHR